MNSTQAWVRTLLAGCGVLALGLSGPAAAAPPAVGPALTVVHQFGDDFRLVGIGVSKTGRVFATAPSARARGGLSMVEVDTRTGQTRPYPDAAWNRIRPEADGKPEWGLVQALWDDASDHLWALDTGIARGNSPIPPKLVEFDLRTNRAIRTYTFEGVVTIKDALNDVRIDVPHHTAYLTAAGNRGGIVVLDLTSGRSRLVLAGDRSAVADPKQHLMIGGREALRPDGSQVVIQTDGVALSPDAQWLYYRPLTDHNYWRVSTAALRDASLSPAALSRQVQYLGSAELSGGLIMNKAGTLFAGDVEHATVVALTLHGDRLTSRVFVRAPGQLAWADGFAISGGDLYIADSHLNEVAFKNKLPRSGPFTIFKVKLPPG
ncbi:MAG TPA: L-dopachrome tautomerase-related protein [Caulobacteraceae bacterium]